MKRLERALCAHITRLLHPAQIVFVSVSSTPWASITFNGARHHIMVLATGIEAVEKAQEMLENLGQLELEIPGHFVADIFVDNLNAGVDDVRLDIEALTVEAA